jgi:hypothetical protein
MSVNEKKLVPRSDTFRWHSKQELCDYFSIRYGLGRRLVESEIAEAMKSFRLRKHQPIKMAELWQKAGLRIEKKLRQLNR